jgi:hypothetical protein
MLLRKMFLVLVLTIMGCGDETPTTTNPPPDTNMTTEGYDKTCAMDTDCVLVFIGNVCGCACTQEAIATGEASRYSAAQEEKRLTCTEDLACQPCPETEMAVCSQGMCAVVKK